MSFATTLITMLWDQRAITGAVLDALDELGCSEILRRYDTAANDSGVLKMVDAQHDELARLRAQVQQLRDELTRRRCGECGGFGTFTLPPPDHMPPCMCTPPRHDQRQLGLPGEVEVDSPVLLLLLPTPGLQEDVPVFVTVDLRHVTHAARALQMALGPGQILVHRDLQTQAQWDARHILEQLVMQCGLTDERDALRPDLTAWLRYEVVAVIEHATDRTVDAARRRMPTSIFKVEGAMCDTPGTEVCTVECPIHGLEPTPK